MAKKNLHEEILKQMGVKSRAKKNPAESLAVNKRTALKMFWDAGFNDEAGLLAADAALSRLKQPSKGYYDATAVSRAIASLNKKSPMKPNPLQPHKKGEQLPLANPETLPYLVQVKMATRWKTEAGFGDYDKAVEWAKKYAAQYPAIHVRVATY